MSLDNAKITKSSCHQMPRNRDRMPHADTLMQATYLDLKGAYIVVQTCTKTLKFTMYITYVVLTLPYLWGGQALTPAQR